MSDVGPVRTDAVRLRHATFNGRSYFYLVNAGETPQTVMPEVPPGTRELVSGAAISSGSVTLQAYELRSYACPAGKPAIGCDEDIMSD